MNYTIDTCDVKNTWIVKLTNWPLISEIHLEALNLKINSNGILFFVSANWLFRQKLSLLRSNKLVLRFLAAQHVVQHKIFTQTLCSTLRTRKSSDSGLVNVSGFTKQTLHDSRRHRSWFYASPGLTSVKSPKTIYVLM